ncbi:MAG: hypothetical protein ABI673_01075 [Novosphingobium sp.]
MPKRKLTIIAGCQQDENGVIHSPYGAFNPVTGEGLPIDAPPEFMEQALRDLLHEGLDSGPARPFDWDELERMKFGG